MANIILFDQHFEQLKPLTYTRPVADLRIGTLTIREKWQHYSNGQVSPYTQPYLATKYPTHYEAENILINAAIVPNKLLSHLILHQLPANTLLQKVETPIALRTSKATAQLFLNGQFSPKNTQALTVDCIQLKFPWDIFRNNGQALANDFQLLTQGRSSQPLSSTNLVIGDSNKIFLEEGAWVEGATLNPQNGPIYIGKNATVMEGSIIRGGFSLGEGAYTKMAAKIYGPTTIGPYAKVGGEINNSVIIGYSNKGHDGFLGNSVLGEWCNLGADTNNSNLKNNYSDVRVWNYNQKRFIPTGLQFCGLIMGDHSKSGINAMFNTGTVVGVSCNIYGSDFPRKFLPSYSWGSSKGFTVYKLDKALETADRMMGRRNKSMDTIESAILKHIFEESQQFRKF